MRTYAMRSINERIYTIRDNASMWSSKHTIQELIMVLTMLTHRISTLKSMVLMPGNRHRKTMVKDVLYLWVMKRLTKVAIRLYSFLNALQDLRSKNKI